MDSFLATVDSTMGVKAIILAKWTNAEGKGSLGTYVHCIPHSAVPGIYHCTGLNPQDHPSQRLTRNGGRAMEICWTCGRSGQMVSPRHGSKGQMLTSQPAEQEEALEKPLAPAVTVDDVGAPVLPKIRSSFSLDTKKNLIRDFVKAVRG
jgi:hypothetical protein